MKLAAHFLQKRDQCIAFVDISLDQLWFNSANTTIVKQRKGLLNNFITFAVKKL